MVEHENLVPVWNKTHRKTPKNSEKINEQKNLRMIPDKISMRYGSPKCVQLKCGTQSSKTYCFTFRSRKIPGASDIFDYNSKRNHR